MELNKAVLDCMQALRRRLRDELAVDIRLSQPDAIPAMLAACLNSNDLETRTLGQRLAEFSDLIPTRSTPKGQPLADVPAPASLAGKPSGSVRIYRGQRIYV
ncbi:hypothetical protein [Pseudomonas indica]|uniref:Uncharacterized protein n=1 Tax=Pseudomonas indica TaxID=137658 RepID=A0A1G9CTQ2_9PSED|nr:hypothetical protein [Pseudomonas indica]MBU3056606.1 hypothetical protein [Pseudomonas indica]PAU60892.1 hypothetical protein BZL42_09985 [Pseudomonas indica]SDK55016.1 hypothetical protein SAMN05216186_10851 [Pseudomonas indica]